MIADENGEYRKQVRSSYEKRYHVVEAADCEAALDCIAGYENKIAAVVLSLTLPEPDGFSVLEVLQREKTVWNIPVIATAPLGEELEERALDMGADDFAVKPHTQSSLWKRVHKVIESNELKDREKALQDAASRDYLTGLFNRRGLELSIEALEEREAPLAVCLFDIDNLKCVNDTYGHTEGDKLIVQFGALLRSNTRGTDILARFGGDEFLVVMKQIESKEKALEKGEKICREIHNGSIAENIPVACSAGIAVWDGKTSIKEVIRQADQALYCAKTENKGGCCLWKG